MPVPKGEDHLGGAGMLLKMGSRGADVRNLQKNLNAAGYSAGSADGVFGKKTLSALKSFQKARGLAVDGLAGKQALGALGKTSAPKKAAKKKPVVSTSPTARATTAASVKKAPALPGLSAQQLADMSARRRGATRTFQEALAQQAAQSQQMDLQKQRGLAEIGRTHDSLRWEGRSAFADAGLARNPRQTGRLFRQLRDQETDGRAQVMGGDASQRAALQHWVDQARRGRDAEHASVEADTVRLKSDPTRLYQGINF